jgi:hypothetical protein
VNRSVVVAAGLLLGCSDLPSKGDALDVVQRDVHEEASCTLPVSLLSKLKMQHTTKAVCVPKAEGRNPPLECMEALEAAGATKRMPASYLNEWPDDVAAAGFDAIPAYERRARALVFKACFELGDLREGRFRCGEAAADHVLRVTKKGEKLADVRYARRLTIDPKLGAIETACGPITRPGPEADAVLEHTDKGWSVRKDGSAPAGR